MLQALAVAATAYKLSPLPHHMTGISLRDLGYQPVPAGLRGKEEHYEDKPCRKLRRDKRRDSVAECSLATKLFRHDAAGDAPKPTRIDGDDNRYLRAARCILSADGDH